MNERHLLQGERPLMSYGVGGEKGASHWVQLMSLPFLSPHLATFFSSASEGFSEAHSAMNGGFLEPG